MRILLAEDDEVLADGLSRALRETGYAVDVVNDGQQADAALSTQECDLLILDLGLPKMSGLEVLRRARARHMYTPVLILTAADSSKGDMEGTLGCFRGYAACISGAVEKGVIYGLGIFIGGTIVVALVIWLLTQFNDAPIIGPFLDKLLYVLNNSAPPPKN